MQSPYHELIIVALLTAILTFYLTRKLTNPKSALRKITREKNEKEKLLKKLQKLETMRKEFVANVSHELKTPITLIKGFVETLIETPPTAKEEVERFLNIINTHADRLNGIITDLLSLSKLEQEEGIGSIEMQNRTLKPILQAAIDVCSPNAEKREISLILNYQEVPEIDLNPALIEQALINLIDNAIKYSPDKTTVQISTKTIDEQIEIAITDQGPGIPEDKLKHLFRRFYRIDKARSRNMGGTGLGLAIVKHISMAHGGEAAVSSTIGNGSTFKITLPIHQDGSHRTREEDPTL